MLKIAQIREAIDGAIYTLNDLRGHRDDEFVRADVHARLAPKLEQLRALPIAPRFEHERQQRDRCIERAEQTLARWEAARAAARYGVTPAALL